MNKFAKIGEGLAAWLTFEQRCGRTDLFSEKSLAHPLGQLLQYRYSGRVYAEVEHPVLAPLKKGPGQKPRIDFAMVGSAGLYDLIVETKWVSQSPSLLCDLLRDVVRLDLLLGTYAREAILVLAGEKRSITKIFADTRFRPHPQQPNSKPILPVGNHPKASVRFVPVPQFRRPLYARVLEPFLGVAVSKTIRLERSEPFPRGANSTNHQVYVWRLIKGCESPTFTPEDEYPEIQERSNNGMQPTALARGG
jgi:hypothetical protein